VKSTKYDRILIFLRMGQWSVVPNRSKTDFIKHWTSHRILSIEFHVTSINLNQSQSIDNLPWIHHRSPDSITDPTMESRSYYQL